MAVSPVLLTLLSVGVGVAGVVVQTSAAVQAANYQAEIAKRNSIIQEENAKRAIDRSQQEQIDQDRKTAFFLGQQVATQSASGLKLGGKSFMLTRKSSRELGRMDALNVRQAGDLEAYNFRVMSEDSAAAAQFARQQASSSLLEGAFGVGSSLIGGAGKLYDQGFLNSGSSNYLKVY